MLKEHLPRVIYHQVHDLKSPQRALPTVTKVESGTSQSKRGTSVNLSNSENPGKLTSGLIILMSANGVRQRQTFSMVSLHLSDDRLRLGWLNGSHISPSTLVYEDKEPGFAKLAPNRTETTRENLY